MFSFCGLMHTLLDYPGSRRVAVFCLLQTGSEVFDTQMMVVDRSVTDICFEGTSILYVSVFVTTVAADWCWILDSAAVETHFLGLSWGWSCGAAPWRTSWRWPTRQRNWPRSSATRLEGARGESSALCWTPQTRTPFCSTTPSQRTCAAFP